MRMFRASFASVALTALGCGSSSPTTYGSLDGGAQDSSSGADVTVPGDGSSSDAPSFGGDGGSSIKQITGLSVTPAQVTLVALNGTPIAQQFQVTATYSDGTSGPLGVPASWSATAPGIGNVDATGYYDANGVLGGSVTVTASYGTFSATASLLVKLHYTEDPGHVPAPIQTSLLGATAPDAVVKWAYPYDQTVFPRGVNESTLMWIGANTTDYYYVHVLAPTFELESYATATQEQWDFTATAWQQFLNSTSGPAEIEVTRWDGAEATVIVDEHVIVANGSMRGTIYYESYYTQQGLELGKVLRLKPGSIDYDDFLDAGTTCTGCHTVSASGGMVVYNYGNWPPEVSNSYDLVANALLFSGFTNTNADAGASQWALSAVSANGSALFENFAPLRGPIGVQTGAFDPSTGNPLAGGGGVTKPLDMPAFSADDLLLAYVDSTTSDLRAYDWDPVGQAASNDRLIVASAANASAPVIQRPTVSPDHQWIVYQRGTALGALGVNGDLFVASVANPGTEAPLAALDGLTYPFAAGARDQHLNYGPTFAPVAAGGYFWIAFHSRRTYGTKLTSQAYVEPGVGVEQVWVAAFDQAPVPGTDPSHPAFYLGGQNPNALNSRAYFALSPCLADGQSCQTGTDCCGGYCDGTPDGGADAGASGAGLVCGQSTGCSQDGDKCATTANCCNAPGGTTCINDVCSEPPPDGGAM